MSKLILYDLPSKGRNSAWSLNPWKTRLALNFKGIDYETQWVEYPDIEPTFKPFGIPPNQTGAAYTIPTIRTADGNYIMDSTKIAQHLESTYPTPSLQLTSSQNAKAEAILAEIMSTSRGLFLPYVPGNLLNPRSAEYFERTRKVTLGMSLEEFRVKSGGEDVWERAGGLFRELAGVLEGDGGPFALGATPSYADFRIVSFLHFLKRIDEKILQRVLAVDPAFGKVYEASKPWLERDDS